MKKSNLKAVLQWLIAAICLFVLLFSVFQITGNASYSVLVDDDFWHGYDVGVFHAGFFSYLAASLRYAKHMYLTWQGTYFSMFLQAFLSPVNNFGMTQLRIVMVFNALNFFVSLLLFLHAFLRAIGSRLLAGNLRSIRLHRLVIATCIIFIITSYNTFDEVFYWFSGATSYSFPLSFLFYSLVMLLSLPKIKNRILHAALFILSILTGVLAMGGSLTVAALGCSILLLVCLYELLAAHGSSREKCLPSRENLILFICYAAGALINTIAPGNFLRQQTSDGEGMHLFTACKNAFLVYESNIRWLFNNMNIALVLLIAFLCGLFLYHKLFQVDTQNAQSEICSASSSESSPKRATPICACANTSTSSDVETADCTHSYTIVSIAALLIPFIIIYPAVLGYNLAWIPNRCVFVVVIAIALTFVNLAVVAGMWAMHAIETSVGVAGRSLIVMITLLLAFVTASLDDFDSLSCIPRTLADAHSVGTVQNYYTAYLDMLDQFEAAEGDLIVDPSLIPEPIDYLYCFQLSADAESQTSSAIAHIYGLNSIRLYSE